MRKILICLLLTPLLTFSQFEDDFSDGNFTDNPQWLGDTERFRVNSDLTLQLNDDKEGAAFLTTANQKLDSTEWHFNIKLDFSPSSNNNARIYLAADEGNPELMTNSFFLQFGESGSDDAITLYQSTPQGETVICRGSDGLISSSFSLNVKVTLDNSGTWKIFIDPLNSGLYELEASGYSEMDISPEYFSIKCNYTVSNSDGFFFDDFLVRPLKKDTVPPQAENVTAVSENSLQVEFSEPVDQQSAELSGNYSLNQGIGEPISAELDTELPNIVHLEFASEFVDHTTYKLSISNIEDMNGNTLDHEELVFEYLRPYPPEIYQVVINEIMADVNPEPSGLPAYDYIELYNRTENLIDLSGCMLRFGSHQVALPEESFIRPHSFLVITDDNSSLETENIIYFTSLPVNTETRMTLYDATGRIIHTVDYKKEWYDDEEKEDGGWSLEIIDPQNPCGCDDNWSASENPEGGTPGETNSVAAQNPDITPPEMTYIEILNDSSIRVLFSEAMDSSTIYDTDFYRLEETETSPFKVELIPPEYSSVVLSFPSNTFAPDQIFTLHISDNASDCSGNKIGNTLQQFANYTPVYGDLVIQEIMADVNPEPRELPPVEYVEIYNRSEFPIDLTKMSFKLGDKEIDFGQGRSIPSEGYLVIAENHQELQSNKDLLLVSHLGITNSGDNLTILSEKDRIIHFAAFKDAWYDDEVKAEGGWSLEMIDNNNYCAGNYNWTASTDDAGGTPGFENAVKSTNEDNTSPDIMRLAAVDEQTIKLYFSERMDSTTMIRPEAYQVTPLPGAIASLNPVGPSYEAVTLTFEEEINSDVVYSITGSNLLKDCMGNGLIVSYPLEFSYPQLADTGDLVINEILFNPRNDGVDFVELYNKSSHAIDISSLYIIAEDPFTGEINKQVPIASEKLIFIKNDFLVLTKDPATIMEHYPKSRTKKMLLVAEMPDFPNSSGRVVVSDIQSTILDGMTYQEDMHFPLLNDTEGVSLERVNTEKPSSDNDNWHSASEIEGFATPGYENSQMAGKTEADSQIALSPEIVTPNNDGRDDQLQIKYSFKEPGYSANIFIYDTKGREIIRLCSNKQLGTKGTLYWDGINADNKLVQTGYYIVFIELFDLKGNINYYKKTVVIAGI